MINTQFNLDEKAYRKYYMQAITFYYMKIYLIALVLGIALIWSLGTLFRVESLQASANLMFVSFPLMVIFALLASVVIAWFDARKNVKNSPSLTTGSFKMKFEKNFMVIQKEGINQKIHYGQFKLYPALQRGYALFQPQGKSIVVPGNILTKEQAKQIRQYFRDAQK